MAVAVGTPTCPAGVGAEPHAATMIPAMAAASQRNHLPYEIRRMYKRTLPLIGVKSTK
jgi:hypothetical protein